MFGNGIIFGGLASGLDTNAIIEQLMAIERIPIQQIEARKAQDATKLDLLGTLEGLVGTLMDRADDLRSATKFFSYTVGMSQEGIATITASGDAQAGSHSLEVIQPSAIDRWAFDGVVDDEVDLASADGEAISFSVGGTAYSVTLTAAASNVHEIAAAINSAAGEAVAANVVNVGTDAAPSYQIVVASKKSGEDFRLTGISETVTGLTIDTTPPDANGEAQSQNNITVGANALASIDGLTIERSDNDFSDVLPGISIDILSSNVGQEMTFTVEPDREAIRGRIEELVTAYNAVIDFVGQQSEYTEEEGAGGELFGDPILRNVRNTIRSALFDVDLAAVQGDTEGYSTLTLVGIEQDSDGRISIDEATLDSKMNENLQLFSDLFVDMDGFERVSDEPNTEGYFQDATVDSGLAERLWRAIDQITSTQEGPIIDQGTGERLALDGVFTARQKVLQASMDRYADQIELRERRLEEYQRSLVQRFAALEKLMGELNARGAALSNALLGLPGA